MFELKFKNTPTEEVMKELVEGIIGTPKMIEGILKSMIITADKIEREKRDLEIKIFKEDLIKSYGKLELLEDFIKSIKREKKNE